MSRSGPLRALGVSRSGPLRAVEVVTVWSVESFGGFHGLVR